MIITCTKCSTSFSVPEEVIPESGRNVKCSKCANIWHVEKPKKLEDVKTIQVATSQVVPTETPNLPALQESDAQVQWVISLVGIIVITFFINFILYFEPIASNKLGAKFLEFSGFKSTDNFAIQDIRIKTAKQAGKYSVNLKYRIYNNSSEIQETPWVRIQFFDKDNNVFYTHLGTNSRFRFQEFQIVPTQAEFRNLKYEVAKVEITIGNKLELYTR